MTSQFDLPEPIFSIIKAAKGIKNLAKALGIRTDSIYAWHRVPEHHLDSIHRLYGFQPIELRPDCFDQDRIRKVKTFSPDNKECGPRRRRYVYKKRKIKDSEIDRNWLSDEKPIAFTARGRKLAGLL